MPRKGCPGWLLNEEMAKLLKQPQFCSKRGIIDCPQCPEWIGYKGPPSGALALDVVSQHSSGIGAHAKPA